ncbi:MAG: hypothetical protein E7173_03065 [Firmicutes bacterium]|nr:hypothetical protein [Bacillota bacterium]
MATKKKVHKNKNDLLMREFYVNQIGLLAQAILVLFTLVFGIATIFQTELKVLFEILLGMSLSVMAFNNLKVYKRTLFTIPYVLGAILAFWAALEILLGM